MREKAKILNRIITEEVKRLEATGRYTFEERSHVYRMDGVPVPSVTKFICKPIDPDVLMNSNFIRKTQMGTDTHQYAEDAINHIIANNNEIDHPIEAPYPDVQGYCDGFDAFLVREGYTFVYSELRIHSHIHHFAGTMDILALNRKGQLVIMDIKTVAKLQPYTALQLAGYEFCFREMFGKLIKEKVKCRETLWLQDKGKYLVVPYKNKSDESVMLCKLIGYQWDVNNGIIKAAWQA